MGYSNFNMRLDDDLRADVYPILEQYGLSPSQAVRMFFNQIARTGKIPLSFDWAEIPTPNSETAQAIRAGRADYQAGRLTGYSADTAAQALADMANHD